MENNTTLHPIHPTLQFEAKHAVRFLDNLLRTRTTSINSYSQLFNAVGIFAEGQDLKEDFTSLQGTIGEYDFKWTRNTLDCDSESRRNALRCGMFEETFGDTPCDFLDRLWNNPQPEVRDCVRAAISRLAKQVTDFSPATTGGVAMRFKTLVRNYRLNARERDILLLALCEAHDLLQFDLDDYGRNNRNFLVRLEEVAAYLGCEPDDILPLVRNESKLVAMNLIDDDCTLSRNVREYLEGHLTLPNIKHNGLPTCDFAELFNDSDCE